MTPGNPELRKALVWMGLGLLLIAVLGLLWFGGKTFLLVFAGILLAVALRAPVNAITRRTRIPDRLAYALVLVGILVLAAGFGMLVGPRILQQAGEFGEQLPQFGQAVRDYLEQRSWGRWLVERAEGSGMSAGGTGGSVGQVASGVGGVLRSVGVTLADFVFVLVVGVFLAANPSLYRRGLVRLFPRQAQQRAGEVIDELGSTLHAWLLGQLALMLITGVATGIGLVILGIPLALALGFFVGLMDFVPLVGPIIGFVPVLIMAFTEGASAVLWVLILYVVIQQLEGNVLVPLVQQRAVMLPPVLTIAAVFLGGALFGVLGVVLGTPLMAVIFVLVKMLYLHDALGQSVSVPGHEEGAPG